MVRHWGGGACRPLGDMVVARARAPVRDPAVGLGGSFGMARAARRNMTLTSGRRSTCYTRPASGDNVRQGL